MNIRPIETQYNGYRFRSRLEARWAVYFDAMMPPMKYIYEPEGLDLGGVWYLPDFYLPHLSCYAEVKPYPLDVDAFSRCRMLAQSGQPVLLLDGPPDHRFYFVIKPGDSSLAEEYQAYQRGQNYDGTPRWVHLGMSRDKSRLKSRLWYDFGEGIESYLPDREAERAIAASRSARFEHRESVHAER